MSHAYAYGMCFLVTLLASAQLVFMRRFNPAAVHRALDRMRISIFPAVPIMLDFLLAGAARFAACPRIVLSAGAPLAKKTFEGLSRRYGIWTRSLYGTTETGGISIGQEEAEWNGSVGVPMKGVEVELCVPRERGFESDARIVRVRSASMMAGYLEGSTINRNALSDGWFETGDLGRVDAQGRIYLHGRLSEVINVFGYKVVPREVEEVILMLPEVLEVKVYAGRYSNVDTVEAAVVCHEGLDESLVIRHCEKHLVSYKCPTAVRFVDSLPRTAAGKVAVERLHGAESH
jgi:long-chain acyl-CoA synthetase